ncbi:unnamed protein product [Periconia digitata]|uniref:Uncharacterized protein n=1 Tax=Periconia digitata TaxID=1303443 RepID=A0A9W4U255_9PLEO|nr:unnamed protein product [Periconia digitata]
MPFLSQPPILSRASRDSQILSSRGEYTGLQRGHHAGCCSRQTKVRITDHMCWKKAALYHDIEPCYTSLPAGIIYTRYAKGSFASGRQHYKLGANFFLFHG